MSGEKIDAINSIMEEIMCDLSEKDSADVDFRFAVLTFRKNCV